MKLKLRGYIHGTYKFFKLFERGDVTGECDIPEQKQNGSLIGISKIVGRPIQNFDDLTNQEFWDVLFSLLGVDKKKIMAV